MSEEEEEEVDIDNMTYLDVDKVYTEIGEFGRQQRLYALCLSALNIYGAWHMLQVRHRSTPFDAKVAHFSLCSTPSSATRCPSSARRPTRTPRTWALALITPSASASIWHFP